jgi:Domain of unknown function (DUF1854)
MVEEQRHTYQEFIFDPLKMAFSHNDQGSLLLRVGGEEHADLKIRLAFPLEAEADFIGFFLADGTELGMLEKLSDLDPESRQNLQDELDKIYFRPRVTDVGRIVEEHGVLRGEIQTTSGPRPLEIRGWRQNVRVLSDNRALIQDVDGNRYLVDDWRELPKMTREILGL